MEEAGKRKGLSVVCPTSVGKKAVAFWQKGKKLSRQEGKKKAYNADLVGERYSDSSAQGKVTEAQAIKFKKNVKGTSTPFIDPMGHRG